MADIELKKAEDDYKFYKELLKGTKLEKFFNDKYPRVFIQQKVDFSYGGYFVCLRTGYNSDQFISFVMEGKELLGCWDHYLTDYCGYRCYCGPDSIIHEDIGYGFGSWTYNRYDHNGTLLSSKSEQDYGCCCD